MTSVNGDGVNGANGSQPQQQNGTAAPPSSKIKSDSSPTKSSNLPTPSTKTSNPSGNSSGTGKSSPKSSTRPTTTATSQKLKQVLEEKRRASQQEQIEVVVHGKKGTGAPVSSSNVQNTIQEEVTEEIVIPVTGKKGPLRGRAWRDHSGNYTKYTCFSDGGVEYRPGGMDPFHNFLVNSRVKLEREL